MIKKRYADFISPLERKIKESVGKRFGKLIEPLLKLLVKLNISPDIISYSSAFFGLTSTVFLWVNLVTSGFLLIISTILDTIDGALARYINHTTTFKGAITDCFTDQITVSAMTLGLILKKIINPLFGSICLLLYPILIIFSIIKNFLKIPSSYILRPRLLIYALFLLYAFTSINLLNYVLGPIALILGYQIIRDFYQLRSYLDYT